MQFQHWREQRTQRFAISLKLRVAITGRALEIARGGSGMEARLARINEKQRKVIFMLRRVLVGDNERVFLIRKGRFEDILGAG